MKVEDWSPPKEEKKPATEAQHLTMGDGFERVITHQFRVVDEEQEYLELRASLLFKDERASALGYGELLNALDAAEDLAHRGAELAARAHLAYLEFEINAQLILSPLHEAAKKALEDRKAEMVREKGSAGKQITNDDVKAEIAVLFPDEWTELETKKKKAKLSVSLFDNLAERLVSRAGHLRTMVARSRTVE